MHYRNGREAKTGDHIITKSYTGNIVGGVVFDLNATGGNCNCSVAIMVPGGIQILTCQDVKQMTHVEDASIAVAVAPVPVAEQTATQAQ